MVELAMLKATRPRFLTSILEPYESQLARLGVPIRAAGDRTQWLLLLHRVLNCDDDATPAALQSAMIEIGDLAADLGHEMIVTQALERDVDLFAAHKSLSRQDLAFHVYNSHPTGFRAAHARLQPQTAPNFVEFYGDGSATPSKNGLERELQRASTWARISAARIALSIAAFGLSNSAVIFRRRRGRVDYAASAATCARNSNSIGPT